MAERTLSLWIRAQGLPTGVVGTILTKRNDPDRRYNYGIDLYPDGQVSSQYETCGSEFDHMVTAPIPIDGTWVHVASTRSVTGEHKLYINGVLSDMGIWSSSPPVVNNEPIGIAHNLEHLDRMYKGEMDEIRIYNRPLSIEEIQALTQAPIPEPTTVALLGIGLLGIVLLKRRSQPVVA